MNFFANNADYIYHLRRCSVPPDPSVQVAQAADATAKMEQSREKALQATRETYAKLAEERLETFLGCDYKAEIASLEGAIEAETERHNETIQRLSAELEQARQEREALRAVLFKARLKLERAVEALESVHDVSVMGLDCKHPHDTPDPCGVSDCLVCRIRCICNDGLGTPTAPAILPTLRKVEEAYQDEIDPLVDFIGPCQAGLIQRCRCAKCRADRSKEALAELRRVIGGAL